MSDLITDMENCFRIANENFDLSPDVTYLDDEQVELLSMAAGDDGAAFFDDLVSTFENECVPHIENLKTACASKNIPEIKRNTHFIAGSSANIGLYRLSQLCRHMEGQCDEGRFLGFGVCVSLLESEMKFSVEHLKASLTS